MKFKDFLNENSTLVHIGGDVYEHEETIEILVKKYNGEYYNSTDKGVLFSFKNPRDANSFINVVKRHRELANSVMVDISESSERLETLNVNQEELKMKFKEFLKENMEHEFVLNKLADSDINGDIKNKTIFVDKSDVAETKKNLGRDWL